MNCLQCNDLIRGFELRSAAYAKARAAPFYRVSTELAARELVDMERARTDLDEHRLVCRFAPKPPSSLGSHPTRGAAIQLPGLRLHRYDIRNAPHPSNSDGAVL
jgi:hypothetical protein